MTAPYARFQGRTHANGNLRRPVGDIRRRQEADGRRQRFRRSSGGLHQRKERGGELVALILRRLERWHSPVDQAWYRYAGLPAGAPFPSPGGALSADRNRAGTIARQGRLPASVGVFLVRTSHPGLWPVASRQVSVPRHRGFSLRHRQPAPMAGGRAVPGDGIVMSLLVGSRRSSACHVRVVPPLRPDNGAPARTEA